MLERGPLVTEPLLDSEQRWLGLERQYVVSGWAENGKLVRERVSL